MGLLLFLGAAALRFAYDTTELLIRKQLYWGAISHILV